MLRVLVFALPFVSASAAERGLITTTWTGNVSTVWTTAGNWTAGVPATGDTAIIDRQSDGSPGFNPTATSAPANGIHYDIKNDNTLTFSGGFNVAAGSVTLRGGAVGGKIVMAFDNANRSIKLSGTTTWTDEGGTLDQQNGSIRVEGNPDTRTFVGSIINGGTGTTGADLSTTAGSAVVTGASATFTTANVKAGQCVWIKTGNDFGWYRIVSVDSQTQLTLDTEIKFTGTVSYEVRAMPTFKHLKIAAGATGAVATGSCIRVTLPNTTGVAFNQDTGFRYTGTFTLGDGGTNQAGIMTESWGHDGGTFNANSGSIITTYSGDIPDDDMASGSGTPLAIYDIDMRLGPGDTANTVSMPPSDLTTCRTIRVRQGVTFNNANGRLIQLTGDWNNWGSYTGAVDAPDIVRFQGAALAHTVRGTTQFSRIELIAGSGPTTLDAGADVSIAKYLLHAHALNGGSPATLTLLAGSTWSKTATFTAQTGTVIWKKHSADAAPQAIPAADPFYNLTIDTTGTTNASAGLSVANDFHILAGTFDAQTFTHTITGNLLMSGAFTPSTSTIVMGGGASEILKSPSTAGSITFYNLTAGNSASDSCTIAFGKTVTSTNLLTIAASSTLNGGTSTVLNTATWTNNGTFSAGTSTLVWDPSASADLPKFPASGPTAHETFYNLTVSGPSMAAFAVTVNNILRIDTAGPINFSNGSLAAGANNVTVKGNLVHNVAGGFSASGAGKLILNGAAQQQISGSQAMAVNILEVNKTGAGSAGTVILAFGLAGDDFTVAGTITVLAGKLDLGGSNDTVVASGNVDIGDGAGAAASLVLVGGVTVKMGAGTILRIRTDGTLEAANTGSVPTLTSTVAGTNFFAIRVEGTVNVGAMNIFSLATTATNTSVADNHGFTVTTSGTFTAFDNVTWDTLQGSGTNDTYLRVFRGASSPAQAYTFNGHAIQNTSGNADANVFLDRGGQVASLTYDASGGAMGGANGETYDRNEAGADITPGSIVWNVLFVWTGAVSTNWHTGGNWDVGSVPGATDSAQVPDVANDPVISANASIKNLTVDAVAILTCSGSPTFTINGTWTLNGTFTPGNSTVVFAGTTSQTVPAATYYNLRLANTGGTNTPASPVTVQNDFTIDAGVTLNATTATINVGGNWTNNGTYGPGTSLVRFNGSGAGTQVLTGITTFFNLEFTGSRAKRIDSNFDVNGTVTLQADAPVSTTDLDFIEIRVGGDWVYAASATPGTFTGGLSTVVFDGGALQEIVQPNAATVTFNNLKIEGTGTNLVLTTSDGGAASAAVTLRTDDNAGNANKGNVNIGTGSTFNINGDTVYAGGNWTVNGTLIVTGSIVEFWGSAAQSIQTSSTFNTLRIANTSPSAQVSVQGGLTINTDLLVNDGILHMGAGLSHTIKNDVTIASGAEWNLGTSTVTVGVLNNGAYGDILVNGTLRMAGTASARPVLQITGDSGGYAPGVAASRPDLTVNGTFVASAVDQNQRPLVKSIFDTGALKPFFRFDAASTATLDFNGATFDASDTAGLVLANGLTVANFDNVTFQNAAGGSGANFYVDLASWTAAGPDTAWTNVSFDSAASKHIDGTGAGGSWFITFVDFTSPYAAESDRENDPANFIRWARTLTWTGSSNSNFNTAQNWSPQSAPTSTDRVIIPDVTTDPVINADRTVFAVTIQTGGILTMSGAGLDLTVTGDFTIDAGGTLTQSAANILSVGGTWTDNGTLTQTAGTIRFTGATARMMKGQGFLTVEVQTGATLTVGDGTAAATMTVPSTGTFTVGNGGNATLVLKNNSTLQTASLAITATDTFTAETGSLFRWMGAAMPAIPLTFYNLQIGDGTAAVSASLAATTTANCDLWIRANATLALAGQTVTVGCDLMIDGTLNGSGDGTVNLAKNFILNGTYTAGPSNVVFNGTVEQTIGGTAAAPFVFNDVTIAAGSVVSLLKNVRLGLSGVDTGDLTTTGAGATLKLNALQVDIQGVWSDGAGDNLNEGTGTVYFNGTAQTIPAETYANLRFGSAATYTLPIGTTTVSLDVILDTGAVVSAGANTLQVARHWTDNDAATDNFSEGTSTVVFNGSGNQTITVQSIEEFFHLTISNSGAGTAVTMASNLNVLGNLNVSAGKFDLASFAHAVTGTTTVGGTLDVSTSVTTMTGLVTINGTLVLTISVADLTASGGVTINGTLNATGSTTTLKVGNNWTDNGTFSAGSSTVRFTGTATISGSPAPNFYNLEVNGGAITVTAGASTSVSNNLLVTLGTFSLGAVTVTVNGSATVGGTLSLTAASSLVDIDGALTVSGTLSYSSSGDVRIAGAVDMNGALTAGTGKLTLDGTGSVAFGPGGVSWNQVQISKGAADIVTVTATERLVAGTLTIVQGILKLQRDDGVSAHSVSTTLDLQANGDLEIRDSGADARLSIPASTIAGDLILGDRGILRLSGSNTVNGRFIANPASLSLKPQVTTTGVSFGLVLNGIVNVNGLKVDKPDANGLIVGSTTTAQANFQAFDRVDFTNGAAAGVYLHLRFTENPAVEVYSKTLTQCTFALGAVAFTVKAKDDGVAGASDADGDDIDIFVSDPNLVDELTFDDAPADVDVILIKKLIWRGTTTAWNDPENWDEDNDGIGAGDGPNWPGSTATALDCEIPTGVAVYPSINVVNTALVRTLTIQTAATLTLNGNRLEMQGGITNSGTLDVAAVASKLYFTGGSAATITIGTLSATNNLEVEINKSGGSVDAGDSFTIGSTLTMTAGALSPGTQTVIVTGATTINGGRLDLGSGIFDLNGAIAVNVASGVDFEAAGTGTLRVGATLAVVAGWLVEGQGTVVFDSAAAQTIPVETYFHLTVNKSAGTATAEGALDINGAFTLQAGTFDPSTFSHTVAGSWSSGGTFAPTAGTVTFDGAGAATIDTAAGNQFFHLTIQNPVTIAAGDTLTVAGNLVIGGTLTLNAVSGHAVTGTTTINAGATLDVATSTATLTGAVTNGGTLSLTQSAANLTAGALTTSAGGTITFGASSTATLTVNGNYNNQGTITVGNGTIRVSGTSSINSAPATGDFYNLVVLGTVTASSSLDIDNNLTVNSGASLDLGGATQAHDIAGTATVAGTLNVNNSELTARANVTVTGALQLSGNATSGNQGELILANAVAVSLQGTLTTSFPAGGFRPKIRRIDATARFGFTVEAGGILNVNGLEFRGVDANGMTIASTASQTTQTLNQCQFFEAVSGARHLWIRFSSGTFNKTFDGCAFDSSFGLATGKNVVTDATTGSTTVIFSTWAGAGGGPLYEQEGANTLIQWLGTTTWTGAVNSNWDEPGNWDNGVPGAEMSAAIVFPASAVNPIMNVNGICANLTVQTTGNLFVNGKTLTVTTNLSLAATGTITMAVAGSTVLVRGNWTNSGGTLSQTTGTIQFDGTSSVVKGETGFLNLQINDAKAIQIGDGLAATTVKATGTVTLGPAGNATLTLKNLSTLVTSDLTKTAADTFTAEAGSTFRWMGTAAVPAETYSNLQVGDGVAVFSTSFSGAVTVNAQLTIQANATVDAGAAGVSVRGNYVLDGTLTPNTSTFTFDGGVLQTANGAPATLPFHHLAVGAGSTLSLSKNARLTGTLTTTAAGATLKLNAQQVELQGSWSDAAADNLAEDAGTVFFNAETGAVTVPAETYNHVTFGTGASGASVPTYSLSGATNVSGNLEIQANSILDVTVTNYALNVKGNWTRTGSFAAQAGTVTFNGTTNQSIATAANFFHVTINNSGAGTSVAAAGNLTVGGNLTVSAGTLDLGTFTHSVTGSANVSAGTLDLNQAALTAGSLTVGGTVDATDPLGGSLTVNGAVSITGTFNATGSSKIITVAGSWTDSGTFTEGTTTVRFTAASTLSGTPNFYNLEVNGVAITVTAGAATAVSNNLLVTVGTFGLGAVTVTVTGSATVGGTLSLTAASSLVDIDGALTVNGALSFSSSGEVRVAGAVDMNGTLTAGTGKLTLDGAGSVAFGPGGVSWNHVQVSKGAADVVTATLSERLVTGTLTIVQGTLKLQRHGATPHAVSGTLDLQANGDLEIRDAGALAELSIPASTVAGDLLLGDNAILVLDGSYAVDGRFIANPASMSLKPLLKTGTSYSLTLNGIVNVNGLTVDQPDASGLIIGSTTTPQTNFQAFDRVDFTNGAVGGIYLHLRFTENPAVETYTKTLTQCTFALGSVTSTVRARDDGVGGAPDADGDDIDIFISDPNLSDETTFHEAPADVDVILIKKLIWRGTTSAWNDPENWDENNDGIGAGDGTNWPGSTTTALDCEIPSGVAVYPSINVVNTALVRTLTIAVGATVTLNGNRLEAQGGISNSGTIDVAVAASKLYFTGSSAATATIGALSATNNLDVEVNKSGGSVAAGDSFTIGATLTMTAGSFAPGTNTVTVAGATTVNGGKLDLAAGIFDLNGPIALNVAASVDCGASGTGTLRIGNTVTVVAGWLVEGQGTVVFDSTAAQTVPVETYFHLTVNKGAGTATAGGALDINGAFTLQAGTFDPSTFSHTVAGNWDDSAGTFVATAGTVTCDGTAQSLATDTGTSTNRFFHLVIAAGSTTSIAAGDDLEVAGNLTITGTLALNANIGHSVTGTVTVGGTLSFSTAKLTATGATTVTGTLNMSATTSTNGELVANGGFTSSGSITFGATAAGKITVTGSYSNTGTMTAGNSTVSVGGAGVTIRSDPATGDFYNLTIASGTVSVNAASANGFDVDNALSISSGATLTLGSLAHDVAGASTVPGTLTITSDVTFRGNVTVGGTMNLNSAAIVRAANSVAFAINGTFATSGGTKPILRSILPGTDRFAFAVNSGAILNVAGLVFNSADANGLTVNQGATITDIDGVDFQSHPGGAGSRYLGVLFTSGSYTGNYDSCAFAAIAAGFNVVTAATTGSTILNFTTWSGAGAGDAFESQGTGTSINWVADFTWIGGNNVDGDSNSNGTLDQFDWNIGSNWSTGTVPGSGANVIIPDVTYDPTLTVDSTVAALTIQDGGQLNMTTLNDLTVNGDVTLAAGATGGRLNLNNTGAILTARGSLTDSHPTQGITGSAGTIRLTGSPGTVRFRAGVTVQVGDGTASTSVTLPAGQLVRVVAGGSFTVLNNATFTLNGKLELGNGASFTVNAGGTWVSNTGAEITTPVPGTDRFNCVVSGATNIQGLTFRSAGTDGLNLQNGNAIVNLRNVTFTHMIDAAGSSHLTIVGTTVNLDCPGCFFDTVPAGRNNVKATDSNGGSDVLVRFEDRSAAENGPGRGETLDSDDDNTPQDGLSDGGGAVITWVIAAGKSVTGSIQLSSSTDALLAYPAPAFDLNTGAYYSTYFVTRDISGAGTADRIWVLDQSGNFKSYSYDVPEANGNIVGTPLWYTVGTDHVLFFGTSAGYLYRLIDTGGALINSAGWPFKPAAVDEVTSPVTTDDFNVYFGGLQGATPKMFGYSISSQSQVFARDTTTIVRTFPSVDIVSSAITKIYAGTDAPAGVARAWRMRFPDHLTEAQNTENKEHHLRNAANLVVGKLYIGDYGGRVHRIDGAGAFTTNDWTFYDATAPHPASPGAGPLPTGEAIYSMIYVNLADNNVLFGDGDGHVYRVATKASGADLSTSVGGNIVTSLSSNFIAAGVAAGDWIQIQSGADKGAYRITGVAATTLTLATSMTATAGGLPFAVVGYVWRVQPNSTYAVKSSPLITNGAVYISNSNGRLFKLNPSTGAVLQTWDFGAGLSTSDISADNGAGVILVATSNGRIYYVPQ